MVNILHAIDTSGPGGAETIFVELATHFNNGNYRSYAVIKREGWVSKTLRKRNIEPIIIDNKGSFNLFYLLKLVYFIKNNRINILQSHLFGSNIYSSMAGIICGIPVVSVFHGNVDIDNNEKYLSLKSKIINKGSTRIIFVSEYLRNYLLAIMSIDISKCQVIHNGIKLGKFRKLIKHKFREQLGLLESDILIGSIGNIRPAKNYNILVDAAASLILKDGHKNYKFLIVGAGDNALQLELQEKISKLGLQESILFLGFRNDIDIILSNLDCFVLCSTTEGFSISIVEAMACGVPIVATMCGGPEEILTNGNNGLLVEANNSVFLAESITKIVNDSYLREKLVKNALIEVKQKYDFKLMTESYKSIYDNLLSI